MDTQYLFRALLEKLQDPVHESALNPEQKLIIKIFFAEKIEMYKEIVYPVLDIIPVHD